MRLKDEKERDFSWGNGGSTEKARRTMGPTVAVALGNPDIHCVEIKCIMDNAYQTRRNKESERSYA